MILLCEVPKNRDKRTVVVRGLEEENLVFYTYRGSVWYDDDILNRDGGNG